MQCAAEGALRFIMSLRAVGEGHLSSVVFHTGSVNADGSLTIRIGGEFPLARATDAPRALESRTTAGKLLLRPA